MLTGFKLNNFLRIVDRVFGSDTNFAAYQTHIYFTKPSEMSTSNSEPAEQTETKCNTKFLTKEERRTALKQRRQLKKEHKEVGFSNDILKQTEYYFENGLRKVYPYYFGWNTTAKERWFGRTLLDIYKSEFSRATVSLSVEHLIESGKIRCNGQIKPLDYTVKNGDRVSHIKHRHEVPVLGDKIKIIFDDENFLVVDKPCSIPIHPCGKYRYNSLSIILIKEMGYSNLRTMYRLDRLTSGLVILAKNLKSSLLVDKHIKERTAQKTYLCRVAGEFPAERIIVNKPIDCASRKIGMYWIDSDKGKEALTEFERISFNGNTSVVKCFPKTGRTHQIRIHLQYLGFPIVNDPLYNHPIIWGPSNGKNGVYEFTKEEIEKNFLKIHTYEAWIIKQEVAEDGIDEKDSMEKFDLEDVGTKRKDSQDEFTECKKQKLETSLEQEEIDKPAVDDEKVEIDPDLPGFDVSKLTKDDECFECKQIYRDPVRSDMTMYLHALSYKFDDLEFKTEYPKWAAEDFNG